MGTSAGARHGHYVAERAGLVDTVLRFLQAANKCQRAHPPERRGPKKTPGEQRGYSRENWRQPPPESGARAREVCFGPVLRAVVNANTVNSRASRCNASLIGSVSRPATPFMFTGVLGPFLATAHPARPTPLASRSYFLRGEPGWASMMRSVRPAYAARIGTAGSGSILWRRIHWVRNILHAFRHSILANRHARILNHDAFELRNRRGRECRGGRIGAHSSGDGSARARQRRGEAAQFSGDRSLRAVFRHDGVMRCHEVGRW